MNWHTLANAPAVRFLVSRLTAALLGALVGGLVDVGLLDGQAAAALQAALSALF